MCLRLSPLFPGLPIHAYPAGTATVLFLVGGHQLGKYGDSRDVPGPLGALARLKSRKVAAKHREEWRASVNKCTGPDDGYVFGGETANVLNFIHKGRGASSSNNYVDARAGSGAATFPSLSEVLRWVWNAKRERGVLAYKVETLTSRRAKGEESGWECILAANFGELAVRLGFDIVFCSSSTL